MYNLSPPIPHIPYTHTYTYMNMYVFKLRQQHELARIAATDETRRTTPISGLRFLALNVFLAIGLLRLRLKPKLLFMLRKWAYSIALHMVLNQLQHAFLPACHLPLQSILDADRRSCSCHTATATEEASSSVQLRPKSEARQASSLHLPLPWTLDIRDSSWGSLHKTCWKGAGRSTGR